MTRALILVAFLALLALSTSGENSSPVPSEAGRGDSVPLKRFDSLFREADISADSVLRKELETLKGLLK